MGVLVIIFSLLVVAAYLYGEHTRVDTTKRKKR